MSRYACYSKYHSKTVHLNFKHMEKLDSVKRFGMEEK